MRERTFRVGADIGGTFTDIVVLEDDGTVHIRKTSSTPDDYSRGIVEGMLALLADIGGTPAQVTEVVHATTVATNAILEGKGARTALVTTAGFRDVIEIARLRTPELYNLNYEKPAPLVPRRRRIEVRERMAADGSVVAELDREDVSRAAEQLRAEGAEAVAVSFLHSYANPRHEQVVAEMLQKALSAEVFVSHSSVVLPEIREYERTSTVVVNAYLGPIVGRYLRSLVNRLSEAGVRAPLQIMQSSGGVMSAEAAMVKPACIIESGPAAGVIAAATIGIVGGDRDLITIDMGGTTAKAAIIEDGRPAMTTEYEVGAGINLSSKLIKGGGHAVKMPFIDVSEIGAGGGSIVRIDDGGLVRVGPDSAGSVPGPACYGAGGDRPTLTDAMVLLGYVNPGYIAGGAVRLDAGLSREAMTRHVTGPAGTDLLDTAHGVYAIAAATMMRAVKAVSTYRGRDPREFTLFAFGGNGPLMGCEIARLLDMPRVVIPARSGVFSALGLLYSDTTHEELRSFFRPVETFRGGSLDEAVSMLEAKVRGHLEREGYRAQEIVIGRKADMRYAGQAYELTLAVDADGPVDIDALLAAFHAEHERTYGHAAPGDTVDLVNLRVSGTIRRERTLARSAMQTPAGIRSATRSAYFGVELGRLETPVMARSALAARRAGPLIVEEYDATCVVLPGWTAVLDTLGNIVLERESR